MPKLSNKIISLDQGYDLIRNNTHLVAAMAGAEPQDFFSHLHEIGKDLRNVNVHCSNPTKPYPCFTDPSFDNHLEFEVFFLTQTISKYQGHGNVYYVPQHLSNWVRNLFKKTDDHIDIFWGTCTPPDERGFVSLGVGACYEPEVLRRAKKVILEINPNMPLTFGATHIPTDWVDHFIEVDHELPQITSPKITDADRIISEYVADLTPNGATIQLGIGSIPNAIGKALRQKKNLGIHTELINDTMMELYEEGVVNGIEKSIWPGKMVGAFVFGSKKLYDFVDQNPIVELQPASVVNDPYRIGRNTQMISVNTAIEVDLTGQVCSESIGHREISGVGGASDTHTGAQRSKGGRGIVSLHSTTKNGDSKIVFELKPGAKVSISRNDIDTVITEYGVAQLQGKSVGDRVKELINIAHPSHRDELLFQAKKFDYL